MEVMRTLECRPEDRDPQLQYDIEKGRKAKIAGEFLRDFLNERREHLIHNLEMHSYADEDLRQFSTEFQLMRAFQDCAEGFIQRGERAERLLYGNNRA